MVSEEHKGQQFRRIEIPPEAREEMLAAASAGQRHAEMYQHAQQTPADLSSPEGLRHHLITAHEYEDHDFYRNSHWRDIDHVIRQSDLDRDMTHTELRRVHDDEHATGQAPAPGVTMGNDHFHE